MNIAVIGSGYVGLVSGACFSEMGNKVTCVDIDQNKIDKLHQGIIPIYEPGLEKMVLKNVAQKNLFFTTELEKVINDVAIVFIAVGTPMGDDGSADLQYVLSVAKEIGAKMTKRLVVVDKSTVPIGTADKVRATIQKELDARALDITFDVVSNPEFLKEGDAISDFMKPDRVVIGAETAYAFDRMKELYSPFFRTHERFITMDIRSAEMTKYAANAMLATKISFMNEIANICERVGVDVNSVRVGIGSDSRIGYSFIYPGAGYGGSCFPKDVKALKKIAEENGYDAQLITSVEEVNNRQKFVIAEKIIKRFGENLSGLTFALWGLAFKPGTDDMRESPAIYVVKELVKRGAKIKAYDPKAMQEAQHFYLKDVEGVSYFESKYDVLKKATALIMLTEWKEFRSPDFTEIKQQLSFPVIFDGRNQYNAFNLEEKGFEYYQIGKK
ncbi:UDP-glucose/GDP-mannose dehydrogenase family protein [Tenacibaculum finnmarkense genomovar finnmarkense]|uniref:UDP-glucose 6-dehydrogenase n=1 Tax=Tenacibaculum finnmarkense genomovar finnmarkense TaxID=1458503 RepID=A0AAP1WG33_9FLAO|nr:UDP-glucose/GDP-mannose dehydrogenase family protein [Tenacibaculum finnmarkense]MBE7652752.1 nucleotide sugar dehydrogenase [Tenacibaculum finnmarkense genomovar finnmarkense]MBE7660897.1 nucleotide sugar dehydrogenase [Tenacibaculum finnmarkense genomovar finnmarkense]MBE7693156.1 nucleotide sugar dehydrogenase [Tenacibaculum finnmarkense genomovar finnmarkense]MBE7694971.1 nucleotide sugar dehydrogenase [Tenacibaculum finnmarkense genomovar finnmarkense]MCD8417446.1 UDP-glucose/GDP-manno